MEKIKVDSNNIKFYEEKFNLSINLNSNHKSNDFKYF